jgi:tRNA(Ile2) C34 agmatinyltransferase TiaS
MEQQLRIPFPDYPAKQQERDAKRAEQLKKTDVYVSRVDGVWNAIVPRKHSIVINGLKGEDLTEFVKNVSEDLAEMNIKPNFRCVRNHGIDAHFIHNQQILRSINNGRD